jgi:hypothetical protein
VSDYDSTTKVTIVTGTDYLAFIFREDTVTVETRTGEVTFPMSDWEFLAKVHGRPRREGWS